MGDSTAATQAFAHAVSTREDPAEAAAELVEQVEQGLGAGGETDLMLLFAGSGFTLRLGELIGPIRQRLRPGVLLGITTRGVLAGAKEHESEHGVAALAARLPGVALRPFSWDQMDWPELVDDDGEALRRRLFPEHDTAAGSPPGGEAEPADLAGPDACRGVLMFADPFTCPTVRLLPAFERALPGATIVGGMASAGTRPASNRLLLHVELTDTGCVGVAFAGAVDLRATVSQGCRPIGRPMVITKSKRHVVQELAGRPALEALREVALELDSRDQRLAVESGLFVGRVVDEYKDRFGPGDFLIRGIAGVDPQQGFIAVGDPQVRTGQTIQLHVRDARAARDDLALLLDAERLHGPPAGAVLLTCTGRGRDFFGEAHLDTTLVCDAIDHAPLAGGFTNGEIGPVAGRTHLHAHAACLLTFREPAGDR